MKNIYILFIALLGSLSMTSCFEEEFDSPVMNTSPEFDMTASSNDVVLMKDNVGMTALELTWNAPDYGVQSANPAYQIKFNGVTVSEVVGETELVLETEELNAFLLENEFEPDVAQTATVQISAKLGTSFYTDSSTQEIQFTAYADQLDLTTTWGLVGSATENGWDGPDMPLTYDPTTDTWKAYVDLGDGEIKLRKNNDWGLNYGDTSVDGYLDEGGDNIAVTAGTYYIQVNFKTFEFLIEKVGTWGLVGSATANGWDGPDQRFMKDFSKNNAWYLNDVTLVDGEIKVRRNNDWGLNYGDTGSDGILDEGGDNIVVTAGTYDFYIDFEGPDGITFTITKK
ncbi:MAG: SusE domain-containing protein [Flavobacteriaceae bacterium]